jgi:hypothetical protein
MAVETMASLRPSAMSYNDCGVKTVALKRKVKFLKKPGPGSLANQQVA